jgi:hypothetical protein
MAVFFVALRGSPAISVLKNPWPDVRCSGERPDTGRTATGLAGMFCREMGGVVFRVRQFAALLACLNAKGEVRGDYRVEPGDDGERVADF